MDIRLSERGSVFMTRLLGEKLRVWLEERIAAWDGNDAVYIDFDAVVGFDAPSFDQCFGVLLEEMRKGRRDPICLCLVNLSRGHAEHIGMVMARRNVCMSVIGSWGWALVGSVAEGSEKVVDVLQAGMLPLRPAELAERVGISGPAAGNRLRRLWLSGVLLREEKPVPHGWEYAYALPARVLRRRRLSDVARQGAAR